MVDDVAEVRGESMTDPYPCDAGLRHLCVAVLLRATRDAISGHGDALRWLQEDDAEAMADYCKMSLSKFWRRLPQLQAEAREEAGDKYGTKELNGSGFRSWQNLGSVRAVLREADRFVGRRSND